MTKILNELKKGDYVHILFIDRTPYPNPSYSISPEFYPILAETSYDKVEISKNVYRVKVTDIVEQHQSGYFYAYYEGGTLFTNNKGDKPYYVEKWYNGKIQIVATSREICIEKAKEVLTLMKEVINTNATRDLKDIDESLSMLK